MKRIGHSLGLLVLAAGCVTTPTHVGKRAPVYDIPPLADVVVDGRADDWGETGFRIDLMPPLQGDLASATDHDVRVRLAWNEEGLVALVTLRDDVFVEHELPDYFWTLDSVEFIMAPLRGSAEIAQWAMVPGMDSEDGEPRWHFIDRRVDEAMRALPAELRVARGEMDGGCVLEVLLPWAALAIAPEREREFALQIYVNEADEPEMTRHTAAWYPARGSNKDSTRMHRMRLADTASSPVAACARAHYDHDLFQPVVVVRGQREQQGQGVAVEGAAGRLATAALLPDGTGRASARIPLRDHDGQTVHITIDGRDLCTTNLPSLSPDDRAERIFWMTPTPRPCVFRGATFPEVGFERPLLVQRLIGSFKLRTTYYDREYNKATHAETPGRYGAVTEIVADDGRVFRRFHTLFRVPDEFDWWADSVKVELEAPTESGQSDTAAAKARLIANHLRRRADEGSWRDDGTAKLLAGLHEMAAPVAEDDFYSHPDQLDRQWWVGFKRRFYGWAERFPEPFVCPCPLDGEPAPVVREGTLEEAGMNPDGIKRIDAVLTEWAADTDEAFAVCIARHGVIAFHKAYGSRDGEPMTLTTKSWMASATKTVSGALVMMLVDQGLINLDDAIDEYVPPLRGTAANKPLTLRRLYNHTSGMWGHWGAHVNDMEERIPIVVPQLHVGRAYQYNGTGMELVCKVLEGITGESLPNLYKRHLLDPLGCKHTHVASASHDANSIPLDMVRIGQMLLNKGAYGNMRFMRPETFEQMLPRALDIESGGPKHYGVGTSMFTDLGKGTFAHGAASSATVRIDPENDMVLVMTRDAAGENFEKYQPRFMTAVREAVVREGGKPMGRHVTREAGAVRLDGMRRHEVRISQLGNLLACARYLGYEQSEAWLAGATAFAFALNVGEGLCPSGPSAWADHKLLPLAANAGLHIKTFYGSKSQPDFAAKQKQAFAQVRQAVDGGMPVIGCEMVVPEVYLVIGYDDDGHYLFLDFEEGKTGKLHHTKLGFLWFEFPELGPAADDRTTVRKALAAALDLAEGKDFDSSACGLRSYDNWIKGLTEPQDGKPGFGAAYNAACWSDSHRLTVPFLREAKQRLNDRKLVPHFDEAIRQYGVVIVELDKVAALFPLSFGEDEQMADRFKEDSRRQKAREALAAAKSAEVAGLDALRNILVAPSSL
ncbi:serine hydrolase [Verrucomicrobiota bacterium]